MSMSFMGFSRKAPRTVATAVVALTVCARVTSAAPNCTFTCNPRPSQIDPCPPINIASQADADSWGQCGNVTGDVIIQAGSLTNLNLNGFESIVGDLIISNSSVLVGISAPNLTSIADYFILSNLTALTTVKFPVLSDVGSTVGMGVSWDTLPLLTDVELGDQAAQQSAAGLGSLVLSNTGLDSLASFTNLQNADSILINDNPRLNDITLSSVQALTNLEITNNGPSSSVVLGNMTTSKNLTISNVANIAFPALSSVMWNLTLSNNTFATFSAPNLTDVFGTLLITNNTLLEKLDLPILLSVGDTGDNRTVQGGLMMSGNTILQNMTLTELRSLKGSTVITGNFSSIIMPRLDDFFWQFIINTTYNNFDCTFFDQLAYVNAGGMQMHGDPRVGDSLSYSCSAYSPQSVMDTAIHYTPPAPKKHLSTGAKVGIAIAAIVGALLIIGIAMRCRRVRRGRHAPLPHRENFDQGLDLGYVGGHVQEESHVERPPTYHAVGKPEEAPPEYESSKRRSVKLDESSKRSSVKVDESSKRSSVKVDEWETVV